MADEQQVEEGGAVRLPVPAERKAPIALKESGALAPTTFEEAWRFAQMIASSRLVPTDYRGQPEDCMIAMQMGAEVGLPPLQAIQSIAVINGTPSLWGDGALALVLRHPLVEDVIEEEPDESNDMTARCTVFRKDRQPLCRTFSRADAQQAGLWDKKGTWQNYPKRMIKARARGFALRDGCADILRGLAIVEDVIDIEAQVVDNQAALEDLTAEIRGGASAAESHQEPAQAARGAPRSEDTRSRAKPGDAGATSAGEGDPGPAPPGVDPETGEDLRERPANIPGRPKVAEVAAALGKAKTPDELTIAHDLARELTKADQEKIAKPLEAAYKRLGVTQP